LKKEIRSLQTELNQSNSDKTKVITGLQEDLKKQLDENNRIKESLKNQLDALKKYKLNFFLSLSYNSYIKLYYKVNLYIIIFFKVKEVKVFNFIYFC
jgi:hypothetical protein